MNCQHLGSNRTLEENNKKATLKVVTEEVPEGDTSYYLTWKDTIGNSKNYSIFDRPTELWCLITNHGDTIGYYKGLSTPRALEYFSTNDSIVQVTFMVGPNVFSQRMTRQLLEKYNEVVVFDPVEINIKRNLRKKMEFVLTQKLVK